MDSPPDDDRRNGLDRVKERVADGLDEISPT